MQPLHGGNNQHSEIAEAGQVQKTSISVYAGCWAYLGHAWSMFSDAENGICGPPSYTAVTHASPLLILFSRVSGTGEKELCSREFRNIYYTTPTLSTQRSMSILPHG